MTVATSTSKSGPYAGAGTTGPFTVDFRFLENAHLSVVKTVAGVETELVLDTDYTVTGAGADSGTVTLAVALASGQKLTITRDVPSTQEADYVQNDAFPAASHELALDKLTMIGQQNREQLARAMKLPVSLEGVSTAMPVPVGGRGLKWNADGTAVVNSDQDLDGLAAGANGSAAAAAASAASAAASYDALDDRFLGVKSIDPALDNDGGALAEGTLYWNGIAKEFRVYNGTGWQVVVPAGNLQKITYVAGVDFTAGVTTTLTLPVDPIAKANLDIVFDAAWQQMTEFSLAGTVVTFNAPIPVGVVQVEISYTTPLQIGTISDGTVTEAKLSNANSVLDAILNKLRFLAAGVGAVYRSVRDKLRDQVSVKDFGAVGDGATDDTLAIQAAINYVNSLPEVPSKPAIYFPGGRYLITAPLQMYANIALQGVARDLGYWFGFNHSSEIIAGTAMSKMIDITGSNSYIGSLGFYGNNMADYGLYTAGVFGRTSSCTIENVAITLCQKTGIHINNAGIFKIRNSQISGCLECGIDGSGFGDAEITGCYINSMNEDSVSTVNSPSSATVYGVGIRLRVDPPTGNQCGNVNIRGGKVEFCRVGILLNSAQGINITGVNFDTCRKAEVFIESDEIPLPVSQTTYNTKVSTSIQITGCRFLGGSIGTQGPSAHIIVNYARYVTIVGNGFKRANDAAADFFGDITNWGPTYGIWLFNAERCTIDGNDLYASAITNCLRIENVTPATAQHALGVNSMDDTAIIGAGTIAAGSVYSNVSYASGTGPIANNTAKAWVRFNGNGAAPVIIASHNVASVDGAGGTYTINGSVDWGSDASVITGVRQWFGPKDTGNCGAVTSNTVVVYSYTDGVASGNGDINVHIFGL